MRELTPVDSQAGANLALTPCLYPVKLLDEPGVGWDFLFAFRIDFSWGWARAVLDAAQPPLRGRGLGIAITKSR